MKKKTKAQMVREYFEANREELDRTNALLRERIEYHRAKREEEQAARGER